MSIKTVRLLLVASSALNVAMLTSAAEKCGMPLDPFSLDSSRNIMQEANFGIVNGKLTVGIPYKNVLSVDGLWAPPYVSTNFTLNATLLNRPVVTHSYTWHPFFVERTGEAQGIGVRSVTMLVPGCRAGLVEMKLENRIPKQCEVPVAITAGGTLDRSAWWEFGAPTSQTATKPNVVNGSLRLEQGSMAIVLKGGKEIHWEDAQPRGRGILSLPPSGQAVLRVAFAIGPAAEAERECKTIADNPEQAMADAKSAYAQRVNVIYQKLPRLKSNNPALDRFYDRSLVHFLLNRWDVPEFILHPYYSTGSVRGGCACDYLWNFGECWEILPLFDAAASRAHIKQFLATDMTKHFAFEPTTGKAFGPWYMVNQEKIVGMIYYYVKNTGDTAFLSDTVNGKTVLQHAVLNAMHLDDPTKPVALIDYGPSNSHLELRRGLPYNHIMPDLNGRRYNNYVFAAELADLAGKPEPMLLRRATELRTVLKNRLWNKHTRWFDFENGEGKKDTRWTFQMFKLLGSNVLDDEQNAGLLEHLLSEKEFLSEFGLHSLAKGDPAYDPADIDCGGPGNCTCFPPQIAERLYKAGHTTAAENILKRILWWGERMPYWGDSIVADRIDYRHDTPLQCTIDGVTVAQCIIFGMFGVRAEFNGDIRVDPHPPTFAPNMEIRGLRIRGHVLDIVVNGETYEVSEGNRKIHTAVGQLTLVHGHQLLHYDPSSQ